MAKKDIRRIYKNPAIRFLILLLIYYIAYLLTPVDYSGSSENYSASRLGPQLLSMLMIAYSTFYLIKNNFLLKKKPLNSFIYFLAYVIISYIVYLINGVPFSLYFLSNILKISIWILPLFLFAFYLKKIEDFSKILIIFTIIYLVYISISMYLQYGNSEEAEITGAGIGGAIFYISPIIFLIPNKRLSSWLYLIAFGLSIVSAKRTPILMMTIPFFFFGLQIIRSLQPKDIIIIILLVSLGAFSFFSHFTNMLIERNQIDAASGAYGSGREIFYRIVFEGWINSNIIHFIFGFGIGAVNQLLLTKFGIAISAHSGFLDILYSYGLIGIIIYLSVFYSLWIYRLEVKKFTPKYHKVYVMFICIWFFQNFIIHGFSGTQFICYTIFIGYIISRVDRSKIQFKNKFIKLNTDENRILPTSSL